MAKLRHPTMSFNFNTPGEVFEVPDEDVAYLCSEHGCEVVGTEEPFSASPEFDPLPKHVESDAEVSRISDVRVNDVPAPEPAPITDDFAIKRKGGWYEYRGRSYRFSKLPPEAIVLELEE